MCLHVLIGNLMGSWESKTSICFSFLSKAGHKVISCERVLGRECWTSEERREGVLDSHLQ